MLKRLVESDPASNSETVIVSLTSLGLLGEQLRARGVRVHALEMSTFLYFPVALFRLTLLIRRYHPSIVQTWMYHSDLIGGLAARLAGNSRVVWNVRSTAIPQGVWSITYWLIRLCAACSYFLPDRIICCATSARESHIKLRYSKKKLIVIPNGYNFSALEQNAVSRASVRFELGLTDGDILVGAVGRFDPLKDFHNFVTAAAGVAVKRRGIKFLMVGRGNDLTNDTLCGWIESAGLLDRFSLVGQQTDIIGFLSAMDVFCLSSVNEAFPNVVVEAMALALPCVVTRAGDAAEILGDERFVVPVKDPEALADALLKICDLALTDRRKLGQNNEAKVKEKYSIEEVKKKYETVYAEITRK